MYIVIYRKNHSKTIKNLSFNSAYKRRCAVLTKVLLRTKNRLIFNAYVGIMQHV